MTGTLAHLTRSEQEAVRRAEQLLERVHYVESEKGAEVRMCARHVIEMGQALNDERAARAAIEEHRDRLEAQMSGLVTGDYEEDVSIEF